MMYLFGETLLSISNNNKLLLHIQTKEGYMYETSIGFYEKIIETRLKIFEVANRNNDIILSTYTPKNPKILIDHNCGHDYHEVNGFNYINYETSCPVCLHKKIVPYVNDCYTLRPDLLKYFKNVNDAIGLAVNDNNKRTYVCPDCGSVRKNTLSNILYFGFSCPVCGDGISYPEKVMFNLLTYLNIKFEYHMRPDWGKYEFNGKIKQAEYDFTIQNKNIIIEMDGSFHYDVISYGDNNTKEIDEYKNTLALCNNYHIIRVDCNYDFNIKKFEYIKNNIIKSLNNIIDLSVVDWDYIERKSFESLLIKACKMWENGMTT